MHISEDGSTLNGNSYYASLSAPKSKHLINENSMQFTKCWNQFNQTKRQCKSAKSVIVPRFSNNDLSLYSNQNEICKPSIATKSTYCDKENLIRGYKRPCSKNIGCYKCQSTKLIYSKNYQLYYVFDKHCHCKKEPQIAQEVKCIANTPKQLIPNSHEPTPQSARAEAETRAVQCQCKCVANKLKQFIPNSNEPQPQCACAEAETQVAKCKCKCVANKLKQFIPNSNEPKPQCACAEAKTQVAKCKCKCVANKLKQFIPNSNEPNKPQCACAEAETQVAKCKCKCLANKLKQFIPNSNEPKPQCACAEAETQVAKCKCKCVANKLKQFIPNSNEPKPQCACAEAETQVAKCKCNCVANKLKQFIPNSNEPKPQCACAEAETQVAKCKCKCVANKLKQFIPNSNEPKPQCACAEAETQVAKCKCKCVVNKLKQFIPNSNEPKPQCACAEAETQVAKCKCKCVANKLKQFIPRSNEFKPQYALPEAKTIIPGFNHPQENIAQTSTPCRADCIKNEQDSFKRLFRRPIKAPTTPGTCVEATTQSPCYEGSDQKADRYTFYREIGTSGTTNKIKYSELPVSKMCCKNRGTICQVCDDTKGDVLKKFCELLIEPKNINHTASTCRKSRGALCNVDGDRDEDSAIKKLYQGLLDPKGCKNKVIPYITGAEVMTQSRSYGGRQQRAGREIFCKNRGTSGAPNFRHPNIEREEYEEVTEELPTCSEIQPNTNKEFGIGTNCKFSLGWFKDHHVYGEPKPQSDFKGTILENPRKEVNCEPGGDGFYGSYKPVMVDRRTGCNGGYITKCSKDTSLKHTSQCARKLAQTSTNCHLDDINKEKGVFTVFCNMMLQPTNLFPVSKKCCKNRGTTCQVSDDNEGGVLKSLCELLIEPTNINHTASPCRKSRGALCNVDGDRDEDSAIKKLYQGLLDPKGCKNKVKPYINGAEVMTQSRSYGGRQQRAGREIFCKNRGTSGPHNFRHPNVEREGYEEVTEELPTCSEIQPNTNKEFGIGTNCKFSLGWFKDHHVYGEPKPQRDFKGTILENPRKEVNYEPSGDGFYGSYKPVMVDRRIGCNDGYITKCSKDTSLKHTSQCARKLAQTSTNCHLDDINKEKGVFTVFCNMMLQPTNVFPGSKKCCKNRGTICQMSDDNEGGVLKKFCELLIEPKNINHTASPCRKSRCTLCNVDGDRNEDSAIKKLYQGLLDPKGHKNRVKPCITGAEVMTQSRSYGGRQQRAGREIFCKNRGTSGAPKFRPPNVEREEYEEVIEELPPCLEIQPDTNKEIGIGTNCKFSLGWYKDRHAYGEPKPHCDFKEAIQQWNEVPLRHTGTKLGASLKTDSRTHFYNSNAATQSRKCRSRHLRAGRETFYKEAQTSCVPKNNKNKVEGNYNVSNQPMQCPANDRKAIRFGSDCSFSFEISKDRNTESPDNSKPCGNKIDENQNKNPFYSKLTGLWRSLQQGNEQKAEETSKSDAITSTHVCDDECQCKKLHDKTCERRPLHIGSKVSYDFNFSKSISPPKPTILVAQEPCISSCKQVRTTKCDAAISAECVPDRNNYDSLNTSSRVTKQVDYSDPIHNKRVNNKTAKECFLELLELVSKKNFLRLIKGDENPEKQIVKEKAELGSLKIPTIEVPQIVCPGKCNSKCQPAEKPEQPLRVESSFSFDYNMRNVRPKHEKTYGESFPRIEDFSGSVKKRNLFRLIIGKVRKRIKKPVVSIACDPIECRIRKQQYSPWFTYILKNIKQARELSQIEKEETDVKSFFSDLLHKPSFCFRGKPRRDSRYLYLMSKLREQLRETVIRPGDKNSIESFLSQAVARTRERPRKRRRRRRGRGKIIPKWYEADIDTLSSSILPSPRKSHTSDEDCKPCQIASDCCFKCDYKKSDNSDNESRSSKSTISSMKYATT